MLAAHVLGAIALVVRPSQPDGLRVTYFAFGSNMCATVREDRRRLRPLSIAPGFVRGERLAFNMIGFSPLEPAFASIMPSSNKDDECHGGVFQLTLFDWFRLLASEGVPFGGPLGYQVREVTVQLYNGGSVKAWTLGSGLLASPVELPPSKRYLGLIRTGARELGLTSAWQRRLADIQTTPFGSRPRPDTRDFERRPVSTFV